MKRQFVRRLKVWRSWWRVTFNATPEAIAEATRGTYFARSSRDVGGETAALTIPHKAEVLFSNLSDFDKYDRARVAFHEAMHMTCPRLRHDQIVEACRVGKELFMRVDGAR